ncbi:hypothetical protein EJ08DRAFT_133246 [Tothia fuscella]|uniref:Uncharacterized protein n=1 Tax=Tothia fuscella TaxID=1048955 RepID=A0A9P4U0H4_9PEZI|nr:hypothetical protein EJ08DRAFT_133246 [Tothia fuscella]
MKQTQRKQQCHGFVPRRLAIFRTWRSVSQLPNLTLGGSEAFVRCNAMAVFFLLNEYPLAWMIIIWLLSPSLLSVLREVRILLLHVRCGEEDLYSLNTTIGHTSIWFGTPDCTFIKV